MRKKLILLLSVFVVLGTLLSSCNKVTVEVEKKKNEFFLRYYSQLSEYTYKSVEMPEIAPEGGAVYGYLNNNNPIKYGAVMFSELGRDEYDFYVIDEKTVYVTYVGITYSESREKEGNSVKRTEDAFYVVDKDVYKTSETGIEKAAESYIYEMYQTAKTAFESIL